MQPHQIFDGDWSSDVCSSDLVVRERMTTQDAESITPTSLINVRPVSAAIREFFGRLRDRKSVV